MTRINAVAHALVTGGAGAIGSRLVRRLLDQGAHHVVVIDNCSSGFEWLLPTDPRVQFLRRDVRDLLQSDVAMRGATVFHLAAFFANQNSVDHPMDDLQTNGVGTLSTLLWAERNEASRFVYASAGCSIVGHEMDGPIREDMPPTLHMDTPYQITKALGEYYCNYFNGRVPTVRCRFFNSYGPGEVPGMYRNVIPRFIWDALEGRPLVITGSGRETRDFIFVDDLVDGLIAAALTPEAVGLAINLGTGVETTIADLAQHIRKLTGSDSRVEHAAPRSWDHSTRRQADISLGRQVLAFAPTTTIDEGLRRTIVWFRQNLGAIRQAAGDGRPR